MTKKLLLAVFLLHLQPSYLIRFRSSRFCLPHEDLKGKPIDLSELNGVKWEVRYHLSSKQSPVNPFYNIFYPENDLSCLTVRTKFLPTQGTIDLICGDAECRIATFTTNVINPGKFMLHPYADDPDCSKISNWQGFQIIDGDPETYLLLYICYVDHNKKVEGGYLLTREGANVTEEFCAKAMRPLTLIANRKDFVMHDPDRMNSCNCTDKCTYYEIRTQCSNDDDEERDCEYGVENFYYCSAVVGVLVLVVVLLTTYIFKEQFF